MNHYLRYTFSIWQVNNIVKALENAGKKYNLDIQEPADKPLPPSSFQMFLKKNRSIPGIVLTDHKEEYSNKWETAKIFYSLSFPLRAFPPLTLVYTFSVLLSIHFLWYWLGEFVYQSGASRVVDHFLYSHYLSVWLSSDMVRRNSVLSLVK